MKTLLKIIIPFVILFGAIAGFKALKASAPEVKSKEPPKIAPEAQVATISPENHRPPVTTFGTVSPYFETQLTAQLSGQILEISPEFRVGKTVRQGSVLVRIDPTDFENNLAQVQANLATAQRTLAEEKIRAEQAATDWQASGRKPSDASDFVLRKPQLKAARAAIQSVQAGIEKALADLERTIIKAPFDAIVTERSASVGNLATPQSALGILVATERVEVRLPLTPQQAARVKLSAIVPVIFTSPNQPNAQWQGQVTRVEPTIDRNQTTTAIAEIEAPFSSDAPLSIGLFVNASLEALGINESLKIPDAALVNDAFIWAVDENETLVKLSAKRLHSNAEATYVRASTADLRPPFRIVIRPLTNFKPGMKISPKQ